MRCADCRDAVSARLDGEDPPEALTPSAVDAHLADCAGCATWAERATTLHRAVRVRPAEAVADRTDAILAAIPASARPRRVREGVRYALFAIGLTQLVLALPALVLAEDSRAPVHVAREMGAFEVALAVGLLATAWRPRLAFGLLPFALALTGALLVTAVVDLVHGQAVALTEAHHLLDLAGTALLALLHPRRPAAGSRPGASAPRPSPVA